MSAKISLFMGNVINDFFGEYKIGKDIGFVTFKENGDICSTNEEFCKLTKQKSQQILGKKLQELLNFDLDILKEIRDKDFSSMAIVTKEGKNIQIHLGKTTSSLNDCYGFLIIYDKTALESYVNDIKNNFSQLKNMINHFNIGFVILNEKHKIVEVNDVFCQNLDYSQAEALKLSAKDYIHDFEKRLKTQKIDIDQPYFFGYDNLHIKKDGSKIPVKGYTTITMFNGQRLAMCFYENISELKESNIRLEHSESMLKNFISHSSDVVVMFDTEMQIKYVSPNTMKVFNYSKSMTEKEIIETYLPLNDPDFINFIKENFKQKESKKEFEFYIKCKNKRNRCYSVRTSTIDINRNLIICYIRDITKDKEYIEELMVLTYTDQLTKLYNRHYMEEQLYALRKPENYPISIISGDLDGLKEVNDSLGHQAGDELLRRFARILRESHDIAEEIFRIGGDEFIIIATRTNHEKAEKIIDNVNIAITKHNSLPSSSLKISASIGYSTSNNLSSNLSSMLALADKEMYKIKNQKKAEPKYDQ